MSFGNRTDRNQIWVVASCPSCGREINFSSFGRGFPLMTSLKLEDLVGEEAEEIMGLANMSPADCSCGAVCYVGKGQIVVDAFATAMDIMTSTGQVQFLNLALQLPDPHCPRGMSSRFLLTRFAVRSIERIKSKGLGLEVGYQTCVPRNQHHCHRLDDQ